MRYECVGFHDLSNIMCFALQPMRRYHPWMVLLSVVIALPALAEYRLFNSGQKWLSAENDESGLEQTLEQNFSPEDRARLKKALADYAKNTDPEHDQIAQKRKQMKESIARRFNDCNRDNDDSLDREETTMCLPQVARHFNYVDVDGDDVITLEELELAQAKAIERQRAAEAKIEAKRIQQAEQEIINRSKEKINKQVSTARKRPI